MDFEKMKQQLIDHEGLRLRPYFCPGGHLTIGVGRNLQQQGISEEEAIMLLENDIRSCIGGVRNLFPDFDDLNEVRQRVLIDMRFNLGQGGLTNFHKMNEAIFAGDFSSAAAEMLNSQWAQQVGQRATRLAEMMRTGREESCESESTGHRDP